MSDKPSEAAADAPRKGGRGKKFALIGIGALAVLCAGAGAGIYASQNLMGDHGPKEDPNRPKLVERGEEPEAPEGGENKEAPAKVGTVSVDHDRVKIDPRKFEVTYFSIDQSFTANLADGSGFVQVGLSLATYYDGKVIANIKRQLVPIRSAVLMTLSQQDPAVIATPLGKQMLQKQLTEAINTVLRQKEGFGGVDNVYFSTMVIQ